MGERFQLVSFGSFTESVVRVAEKFCWRGYRVLTFCPVCMREILRVEETRLLVEAFASPQNSKLVEAFAAARGIGLFILVPSNRETAQLLNHRLALAPVCSHHSRIDAAEVERNVLLASGCGEVARGGFL